MTRRSRGTGCPGQARSGPEDGSTGSLGPCVRTPERQTALMPRDRRSPDGLAIPRPAPRAPVGSLPALGGFEDQRGAGQRREREQRTEGLAPEERQFRLHGCRLLESIFVGAPAAGQSPGGDPWLCVPTSRWVCPGRWRRRRTGVLDTDDRAAGHGSTSNGSTGRDQPSVGGAAPHRVGRPSFRRGRSPSGGGASPRRSRRRFRSRSGHRRC